MVNIDEKLREEFKIQNWIGETKGFPGSSAGKESAWDSGDPGSISWLSEFLRRDGIPTPVFLGCLGGIRLQWGTPGLDPWAGKIPWSRAWQPAPVFLPGESPWTQEPGGLQSMGVQKVRHDWAIKHSTAHEKQSLYINKISHVNNRLWVGEGWERGSRRRGYIYTYVWFPLVYGRNQHNTVKQLAPN